MFACRACRVPLSASSGCAVCDAWRPHLVAVDEDQEESPALATVGSEVTSALRALLKDAKKVERDPGADARAKTLAQNMILRVANTLAKVLEAARKLQSDGLAAVQAMSWLERAKLFVGWYAALPPPHREQLRKQLDKWEQVQSQPRELPSGD